MIICSCKVGTDRMIKEAIAEGLSWVGLVRKTRISTGCGRCRDSNRALYYELGGTRHKDDIHAHTQVAIEDAAESGAPIGGCVEDHTITLDSLAAHVAADPHHHDDDDHLHDHAHGHGHDHGHDHDHDHAPNSEACSGCGLRGTPACKAFRQLAIAATGDEAQANTDAVPATIATIVSVDAAGTANDVATVDPATGASSPAPNTSGSN